MMKKTFKHLKLELIHYKTAKDVVFSFFRDHHPRMIERNLYKLETDFSIRLNGVTYKKATVSQLLKAVRGHGVWGYCEHTKNGKYIHYWSSKQQNRNKILTFLGHELGHAIGYVKENDANKFGAVTAIACYIYDRQFKKHHKIAGTHHLYTCEV